jgi:hypothetical protein
VIMPGPHVSHLRDPPHFRHREHADSA